MVVNGLIFDSRFMKRANNDEKATSIIYDV